MRSLLSFKGKKIALITHSGCDVDAICAAASLYFFLHRRNKAEIIVPEHISLPAKAIAEKIGIPFRIAEKESLQKFNCLFLVDFNDLKMAGSLEKEIAGFRGEKFLIDHHRQSGKKIANEKNSIVDPNAVASCELVFGLFKASRITLGKKIAACIAAGIVADSAHFMAANSKTFSIMAAVLEESGKDFAQILSLFSLKQGFDEKIAKLKAAKRLRIFLISGNVVVTSDVGAFEADAASALVKIGADIAFVGDSDEGNIRISGRAAQHVLGKTGFDLAKHIFQQLPAFFPGSGGGHPGAAGFNGEGNDIKEALMQCVELAKKFFQKKPGYNFKEYA